MNTQASHAMETPNDTDSASAATQTADAPLGRLRNVVMARLFDDAPTGEQLGRYVLDRALGSGGMGAVFEAHDPKLDRKVAVKLLHWRGSEDEGKRLLREAKGLARLSHPNVVQVHDAGEEGGRMFLAMELVRGTDLHGWLRERPRAWREVVDVFIAAGQGLAAAHAAGLVHRDFKPANVLVSDDGEVKVADFGLVRDADGRGEPTETDAGGEDPSMAVESLTRTGAVVGTPAYMAPEQLLALDTDARTDQFSFCVALFQGIYGTLPHPAKSLAELIDATGSDHVAFPRRPRVPGALRRVLRKGLRVEPGERFADMPELLRALRAVRRPVGRTWALGLGALGLAAVSTFAMLSRPEPVAPVPVVATCDTEARVQSVWDAAARDRVHAHLTGVSPEIGEQAATTASAAIDEYLGTWSEGHASTCEASSEDAQMLARRLCLESRLQETRGVISVLERADDTIVANVPQIVAALEPIDECMGPLTVVRTASAANDELSFELARARSLWHTRRFVQAHAAAEALAKRAAEVGEPSIESDAWLLAGMVANFDTVREGDETLTRADYEAALEAAHRAGDPTRALRAEVLLVWAFGGGEEDVEAAKVQHARLAARVEASADPIATWAYHFPLALPFPHNEEGSRRGHAEHMLEVASESFGSGHRLLELSQRIARLVGVVPRPTAEQHRDQTRDVEAAFGALSPRALEEQEMLARTLAREGKLDEAKARLEATIAGWTTLEGAKSTQVGDAWRTLAHIEQRRGDDEAALSAYDHAIEALDSNPFVDHKGEHNVLASTSIERADVLLQLDRPTEAIAAIEHSDRVRHPREDEGFWPVQRAALAGSIRLAAGDPERALAEYEGGTDPRLEPDDLPSVFLDMRDAVVIGKAEALLALGRPRDALDPLRKAWTRLDGTEERSENEVDLHARAGLALSRALAAIDGDDPEIATIAASALGSLPSDGVRPRQVRTRAALEALLE